MIKINLLGRKKIKAPLGLDTVFAKLGFKPADLLDTRGPAARVLMMLIGMAAAYYLPNYLNDMEVDALDARSAILDKQRVALQKELASKKEINTQMKQLEKDKTELQHQLDIINSLNATRNNSFMVVDKLTQLMPTKVWADKLEYNKTSLLIEGASWEYFAVNEFIRSLSDTSLFDAVTLKNIQSEDKKDIFPGWPAEVQKTKKFVLEMLVKGKT